MGTNLFNPADKRQYPRHWKMVRGKQLFTEIDARSQDGNEELLSVSHLTGITPRSQKNVTMFQAESLVGYKLCDVGDIAANTMWTWQGAIGVSKYHGVISPAYNVYRQTGGHYNPRYLDFLLRETSLVDVYNSLSTGIRPSRKRLYPNVFLTIYFPVPPRDEQEQIVRVLDWKVSVINGLINAKKSSIRTLLALRQSIVDANFSISRKNTRESNWICCPLKHCVTINDESLSENTPENYELDYIDIGSVGTGKLNQPPEHFFFSTAPSRARRLVKEGDTILSTVRTYLRAMVYIDSTLKHCIVSTGFAVLRPKQTIFPKLLNLALSSSFFIDEVMRNSKGVSYPAIDEQTLLNIAINIPESLENQKELTRKLEHQLSNVDFLIGTHKKNIQKLNDIKTRLISDIVTGKVDVRNIVIPDYEYVDELVEYSDIDNGDDNKEQEEECK